jgi:hypothetical protein
MLVLVASTVLAATPFAGLEWRPLSRADLAWVAEDRTSGDAVGEFDGVVRPALQAFGGAWLSDRVGLAGSLGVARLTTTSWTGETARQRHWGVIRPELDLRVALTKRSPHPLPWLLLGFDGDIPSARDVSDGYTADEQAAADRDAQTERLRLGGFGGRLGAGVDARVAPGVSVGACFDLAGHFGVLRSEDASTVSSWLATGAAVLVTFDWDVIPTRRHADGARPPPPHS